LLAPGSPRPVRPIGILLDQVASGRDKIQVLADIHRSYLAT
jgi:hypothetical protein